MEPIRIPRKLLLSELLRALGCHGGQYTVWAISAGRSAASVSFVCNVGSSVELGGQKFCYGKPASTAEEAQENAAKEAIKFLQRSFGVDVDDVNYWEKAVLSCHNYDYAVQARCNEKKIEDLVAAVASLKDGWEQTIRELVILCESGASTDEHGMNNAGQQNESTGVSDGLGTEMINRLSDVISRMSRLLDDVKQQIMERNVNV